MSSTKPHFLLFCDGNLPGRWRFVLESVETGNRTEATDVEQNCATDRCALISVLRGLESLEQPSRVTLVTTSRYVTRGLQYGLAEWRENDFSWEHFGAVQPIRNADIWRRIDRTLAFHLVQCRWMSQGESPAIDDSAQSEGPEMVLTNAPSPTGSLGATKTNHAVAVATTRRRTRGSSHPQPMTRSETSPPSPTGRNETYHRIYVDTPKDQTLDRLFDDTSTNSTNAIADSVPECVVPSKRRLNEFTRTALAPFRLAKSCTKSLCHRVWDAILAIDEWLESFLRCLVLLDPKDGNSRR